MFKQTQHKFSLKTLLYLSVLAIGTYLFGAGIYIHAKANLAQYLIQDAWQQSMATGQKTKPWSWADTWPSAKLRFNNQSKTLYVLEGATEAIIAFAPGHLLQSAKPGEVGNSVIFGHRDTHFKLLQEVKTGDIIETETMQGLGRFRVEELRIVHASQLEVMQASERSLLTLITCYPFNSTEPSPELRYVVKAYRI